MTLTNSTLSGNIAKTDGDAIYVEGAVVEVSASIVDGDCEGIITSNGYNIESPGNTCGFDQTGDQSRITEAQLNLGELADNGGPTETRALLPGSFAIDVIPPEMCEVDEDQRGEPRPVGDACDVGAFERQPEDP